MAYTVFKRLALLGSIMAFCVVVLGAYVRLSDAGLGCPDWPGCYGTLTVPQSEEAIQKAQQHYPNSTLETAKAWKEMAHRYLAGSLGLVILALFIVGRQCRQALKVNPLLPGVLLLLVIVQAALGMWTVTMLLKPAIVSAHLIGGMTTLGLLTWIAHRHIATSPSGDIPANLKFWLRGALLILLVQIFLGGWTSTNYAALACTDFPTCHGAWLPHMDFKDAYHMVRELGQSANGGNLSLAALTAIQWTHRVGALITLLYLGLVAIMLIKNRALTAYAGLLLAALFAQICIGIANLLLHLPLPLAVAHNAGAALLVIIIVIINSHITKPA